jgi:hypothetical protein
MTQYLLDMIKELAPLQFVASTKYVEVPFFLISIEYDVMVSLPSAGADHEIYTPPVVESMVVVTANILEGTVAALIETVEEYDPQP